MHSISVYLDKLLDNENSKSYSSIQNIEVLKTLITENGPDFRLAFTTSLAETYIAAEYKPRKLSHFDLYLAKFLFQRINCLCKYSTSILDPTIEVAEIKAKYDLDLDDVRFIRSFRLRAASAFLYS